AAGAGACLGLAAAGPLFAAAPKAAAAQKADWSQQVVVTANGSYMVGNPAAQVKVTEYVSYTCPHCAEMTKESDPVLRGKVIPQGKVALTVTNLLRNPVDLTVAMLTACGDPKGFFKRHNAFMENQEAWLGKASTIPQDKQELWYKGTYPERMRAMAADFDFYATMAPFGFSHAAVDKCFDNKAQFDKLSAQMAEAGKLGLNATPSFTLNGKVLAAHSWPELSQAITDAIMSNAAGKV
ncbi:DsbA family protein, partial [Novosphingobium sp. 1949]